MNNKKSTSHTDYMKKYFLLLSVLLVLCIACFAGCTNKKPVATSSQTEVTETEEQGMPNARRENKRKRPCSDGDCEDGYFDISRDDFGCKIIFNISFGPKHPHMPLPEPGEGTENEAN